MDAVYIAMMGCKQWRQLEGPQTGNQVHGFTSAVRSLDGRLTAQLNAGACLIHLLIGVQLVARCFVTGLQSHVSSVLEIECCPCAPPFEKSDTHSSCLLCMLHKGLVQLGPPLMDPRTRMELID